MKNFNDVYKKIIKENPDSFVVIYEPIAGHPEVFGPFLSKQEAIKWMKSDVEYNINNAKNNGVDFKAEFFIGDLGAEIKDYGKWFVAVQNNPEKFFI